MPSPHASQVQTYATNLIRLYRDDVTESERAAGRVWYPNATAIMREWSDTYSLPLATVASVTAALSPQLEWTRNLVIADDVLAQREPSIGGALFSNIEKATKIRAGSTIAQVFKAAPKVASFAVNLAGDYDHAVTVDTHAAQAAVASPLANVRLTIPAYSAFVDAYTRAAYMAGLPPAYFQATIWLAWKRMHPAAVKRVARRQW